MKTRKRTFLGIDITRRKALYAEIDALTEECADWKQVAERRKNDLDDAQEKIRRKDYAIADLKRSISSMDASMKKTSAAYEKLKREYESLKRRHDDYVKAVSEERAKAKMNAESMPIACETARVIGYRRQAQPRDKGGRFEKSKRDDNPRK